MTDQGSGQTPVPLPSGGEKPAIPSDYRPGEEPSGLPLALRIFLPGEYYLAGLVITSVLVPNLMAAVTSAVLIGWWADGRAMWIGILAGLLGWGIMALVAQHFATVDRANPAVYQELRSRYAILRTQMNTIQQISQNTAQRPCEDPHFSIRLSSAKAEMETYLRQVQNALGHWS
jgi:hypothetical protein